MSGKAGPLGGRNTRAVPVEEALWSGELVCEAFGKSADLYDGLFRAVHAKGGVRGELSSVWKNRTPVLFPFPLKTFSTSLSLINLHLFLKVNIEIQIQVPF